MVDRVGDQGVITRSPVERAKVACLSTGLRIGPDALSVLKSRGEPLSIHEYPTTGGITFVVGGDTYVNAPFDEWFCGEAEVELAVRGSGSFVLVHGSVEIDVGGILPLPGYLEQTDAAGRLVVDTAMSHADRVRISPVIGCAYDCGFCDLPAERYSARPIDQLVAALDVASADDALPSRHVLISGGTAGRKHRDYFEHACRAIIARANDLGLPTDIMMSATEDLDLVDRLVDDGVAGFSINLELFSEEPSALHIRQKHRWSRPSFSAFVERAVERTGGHGRVRSLILVGLEPIEETLRGVEHIAALGADPVLSPFRPAGGTRLVDHAPPTCAELEMVHDEADRIARSFGVRLGPRCLPCQHNTLTFPRDLV
jgi:hypothetical protein